MMMGSEYSVWKNSGPNGDGSLSVNELKESKMDLKETSKEKNKPSLENAENDVPGDRGSDETELEKNNLCNGSEDEFVISNQKSGSTTKRLHSKMNGVIHNSKKDSESDENANKNASFIENGINGFAHAIDCESNDSEDKPYKCHMCPKQFARKSGLNGHVLLHVKGPQSILSGSNGSTPVEDVVTNNNNDDDLKSEPEKEPEGVHSCVICEKRFNKRSILKSHILQCRHNEQNNGGGGGRRPSTDHDTNERGYGCMICDQRFSRKSSLVMHYKNHPKSDIPKEFLLEDATKSGGNAITDAADNHRSPFPKKVGGGDEEESKPYKCDTCGKEFSRNSSLQWHLQFHENEKKRDRDGHSEDNQESAQGKGVLSTRKSRRASRASVGGEEDVKNTTTTMEANDEEEEYRCHLCDRTFERKKGLYRHIGHHRQWLNNSKNESMVNSGESKSAAAAEVEDNGEDATEFKCEFCGRYFKSQKSVRLHKHHAHRDQISVDSTCDDAAILSEVEEDEETEEEDEEEEEEKEFICKYCDRPFQSKRARSIHSVSVHKSNELHEEFPVPETLFSCTYCGRDFNSGRSLNIHMTAQHRGDITAQECVFKCDRCSKEFSTSAALKKHARMAHKESYRCDGCEQEFELFLDLREHLVSECNGKRSYACKECPKVYSHPNSLTRHMRDHKRKAEESMMDEEQDGFEDEDRVAEEEVDEDDADDDDDDIDNKTGDLPYRCSLCPKSFRTSHGFAGHMKVHSAEKANAIQSPTLFAPADSMAEDSAALDGELKTYACQYCSKVFDNCTGYAGHMRIHKRESRELKSAVTTKKKETTGSQEENDAAAKKVENEASVTESEKVVAVERTEKVYPCKYCGIKFTTGTQLGGHIRIHKRRTVETDAAEYSCDHCGETYCDKKKLADHVRIHFTTPSLPRSSNAIECQYCNRYLNSRDSLRTHMYRFHRSKIHLPENEIIKRIAAPPPPKCAAESHVCDLCERQFGSRKELRRHSMRGCTGVVASGNRKRPAAEDNLKCDYCGQIFLLQCHLQKHLKSRCNAVDLESMETDESAPLGKRARRSTFMNSMFEYDTVGTYPCDECDKSFTTNQGLLRHQQRHRRSEPLTAAAAPTSLKFTFKEGDGGTSSQVEARFREKPHECVYCGVCFGEKESLLQHVRTHAETEELSENYIKLHAGERCVIESADGDEEHFIFEQFDQNEGYECSECFETIQDKLQMIVHMTHHLKNRRQNGDLASLMIKVDATLLAPFECKLCDERFVNKTYRAQHLRKRHANEVLQCDVCQKLFLYKEKLKQHCRQHSTDTKYRCEYCRRCFTSKWFLKRHTRRHCMKKPAEVNGLKYDMVGGGGGGGEDDPLSTSVKQELANEIVMYRCENCDFESENKAEVENHSCLHAMDTISCDYCLETFLEEQDLITHMESHVHETEAEEATAAAKFEPKFNPGL